MLRQGGACARGEGGVQTDCGLRFAKDVVSFFFAQTHVGLVSARSDGPDQADSGSTTYLSRVIYSSYAACQILHPPTPDHRPTHPSPTSPVHDNGSKGGLVGGAVRGIPPLQGDPELLEAPKAPKKFFGLK